MLPSSGEANEYHEVKLMTASSVMHTERAQDEAF